MRSIGTPASCWQSVLPLFVLLALFALPNRAHAQNYPDEGLAFAACFESARASVAASGDRSNPVCLPRTRRFECQYTYPGGQGWCGDYFYPDNATCAMRVDGQTGMVNGTITSGGICDRGCKVQPNWNNGDDTTIVDKANSNEIKIRRGTWSATGGTCDPNDQPAPPPKDEFCHSAASYTVCKTKDQTCVSTTSGYRTCSTDKNNLKGQTNVNSQRTEGVSISAPNTPPNAPTNRQGENWQANGQGGSVTNSTSNQTINYNTYFNGGTSNTGNPVDGDGSGGNGDGDGEGEGEGGTVGGNGECTGSFTCSGGDAVLCAMAQQTFKARCEAASRWDTLEEHEGEGGSGSFPGEGDGGAGEDPDPKEAIKTATPRLSMLDSGGFFGGGQCPEFPSISTSFGAFSFDGAEFCKLIGVARTALLLLGAFLALGILMGWQGRD